jgi:hypothetical protein
MDAPKTVVANFQSTANPVLSAAVTGKANGAPGTRVWTIQLRNTGLGTATAAQITGVALTQVTGTPCSPAASVVSTFPVTVGDIAPSASLTGPVTFNFSGCQATARFTAIVSFSANGGAYTGSTTINNQTR